MNHNNETLPSTTSTTGTYFTYHIPGMDINPGPYIFTLVSHFLGIITPDELPLGMAYSDTPLNFFQIIDFVFVFVFFLYHFLGQVRQLLHYNLTLIEFATNVSMSSVYNTFLFPLCMLVYCTFFF